MNKCILILCIKRPFVHSWFFLSSNAEHLPVPVPEMYNYLAGGLVLFNLTSMQQVHTFHLELTVVSWQTFSVNLVHNFVLLIAECIYR